MTSQMSAELDVTEGVETDRPSPPVAWAMFLKEWGRGGCGLQRLVVLERYYRYKKARRSGL